MGTYFDHQPASRVIRSQTLTYTSTTSTVLSTTFTAQTYQVRLIASLAGNVVIGDASSVSTTSLTTAGLSSGVAVPGQFMVPVSTAGGEYFTCTPGQVIAYCSTSTSTGQLNVAECA